MTPRPAAEAHAAPGTAATPTREPNLDKRSAAARLAGAVLGAGLLASTLVCLHALGTGLLTAPPIGNADAFQSWLSERDPVLVGFALLRLMALAAAWYLVAVITLGVLARLSRVPGLITWADMATLPLVRRSLTTLFGLSLTAAVASVATVPIATSPQHLAAPEPDAAPVPMQGTGGTVVVMRADSEGDDEHTATMRLMEPLAPPAQAPGSPAPSTWTVASGDSLWSLAADHLEASWERSPSDQEVLGYWQQTVEHNRTRLVDPDNPELIYAGQVLEAPPLPALPMPQESSTRRHRNGR